MISQNQQIGLQPAHAVYTIATKQKTRVLHITETTISGVRRHILSLLRHTNRMYFHLEIASPCERFGEVQETGFVDAVRELGVQHHQLNIRREIHPTTDLRAVGKLVQIIRQGRFDIVHTHSSKAGVLGRIAAQLAHVHTVHTPNGFYFLGLRNTKRNFYLWLERFAGLMTNQLIAVSESENKQVVNHRIISPRKVVTIPNSIDIRAFTQGVTPPAEMRHRLGIAKDAPLIGTVARHSLQKDPFTFVQAAARVLNHLPQTHFIWCGEGEMRAETEALTKQLGIQNNFHFLGFRKDVNHIMNSFDLFVLSSKFEGLPYTLLEAMALGLPIIATNVVGNQDVINHKINGLLVPPEQPDFMAKAMLELMSNPYQRHKLGMQGRQFVENNFSIEQMIHSIENVYHGLVNG